MKKLWTMALFFTMSLSLSGCMLKDTFDRYTQKANEAKEAAKEKEEKENLDKDTNGEDSGEESEENPYFEDDNIGGPRYEEEGIKPLSIYMGTHSEWVQDKETYYQICYIDYPYLSLEEAKEYPELCIAFEELNAYWKDYAEQQLPSLEAGAGEMYDLYRNGELSYFDAQYENYSYEVVRADERVVSMWENSDGYWGGAHGGYASFGKNFDPKTGEELTLSDVLTDTRYLPQIISTRLAEEYPDMEFFTDVYKYVDDILKGNGELNWVLTHTGIMFHFNVYEIGSYADGAFSVEIPFEYDPNMFNPYYTESCQEFFKKTDSLYYDLNGDGSKDSANVYAYMEDWSYREYTVRLNDAEIVQETWAYELAPYFLHTEDGRTYLYVELTSDNDYKSIDVFDLNGVQPVCICSIGNAGFKSIVYDEQEYYYATQIYGSPEVFYLKSKTDMFSTLMGYRAFELGEEGIPVPLTEWYMLDENYEHILTLKQDIKADIVDEAGNVIEEDVILSAGVQLPFYRTDNANYTDFLVGDEIYRITVDSNEWIRTVDGVDIDEIFEGMLFAG